jgi:uncharacterized cysteine cluster protein YcgN (CxxCxxCC family)
VKEFDGEESLSYDLFVEAHCINRLAKVATTNIGITNIACELLGLL